MVSVSATGPPRNLNNWANSASQLTDRQNTTMIRLCCCTPLLYADARRPVPISERAFELGALGGTRTPNLLIRSQMLYPLSYERSQCSILHSEPCRCVLETRARPLQR